MTQLCRAIVLGGVDNSDTVMSCHSTGGVDNSDTVMSCHSLE